MLYFIYYYYLQHFSHQCHRNCHWEWGRGTFSPYPLLLLFGKSIYQFSAGVPPLPLPPPNFQSRSSEPAFAWTFIILFIIFLFHPIVSSFFSLFFLSMDHTHIHTQLYNTTLPVTTAQKRYHGLVFLRACRLFLTIERQGFF